MTDAAWYVDLDKLAKALNVTKEWLLGTSKPADNTYKRRTLGEIASCRQQLDRLEDSIETGDIEVHHVKDAVCNLVNLMSEISKMKQKVKR